MPRSRGAAALGSSILVVLLAACSHSKPPAPSNPVPEVLLAGIAGQALLVTPVQTIRVAPELAWPSLTKPADLLSTLDRALADTLRDRVRNPQWVFADALIASAKANPTYATDPHLLSIQSLRSPRLEVGQRLAEPLASQLRTMLALQDGRLILIPVELRFEKQPTGMARAVLHLVLVDPRRSDVSWFGDVAGADLQAFTPNFIALLASRAADLFAER
jgi:hypothetical protein